MKTRNTSTNPHIYSMIEAQRERDRKRYDTLNTIFGIAIMLLLGALAVIAFGEAVVSMLVAP